VTRRLYAQFLPVLLVTLALTGCAFDPPTIERTPREIANVDSTAKSRLGRRGAPAGDPQVPGEEIQIPGEEVAALEVDLTNFKERLIGLDSDEINDLMGAPGLERAEPPALIWQYRGTACTVDIFMFDDGAGSTVDHVEVRGQGGEKADEKVCFTGLLRNTAALAPKANVPPAPAPIAGPPKPGQRGAAQPARGTPQAAPAAAARGAARTPAPAARTPAAAPASAPAVVPPAPKAGEDFEEDDTGPPSVPPSGAAAKAPPPPAAPKTDEFEIEADPDTLGPVRDEDDPAGRNEDMVE